MMKDIFIMSLDAMNSYKVRTFLTLIGVVIGVGSVIMVTTAGNSVGSYVGEQWNIFNPTGMVIGTGTAGPTPQLSMRSVVFTDKDVENLNKLPHVKAVAPVGIILVKKVLKRDGFLKWEVNPSGETMYASTPLLLDVLNLKIANGDVFTENENEIVISKSLTNIFGTNKPLDVGDIIYIQRIDGMILKAKIAGILEEGGSSNIFAQMTGPAFIGPVKPYYASYFGANVGGLFHKVVAYSILLANADDKAHVTEAKNAILTYLNSSKSDAGTYKDKSSDFVIITQQYIIERIDQIMGVIRMYITAIALISLLIGAIGIANIMFATVTERTREIGTMMAIGAKRRDILQLFLFQSTIIGLIGGVLGCILGATGSAFVIDLLNRNLLDIGGVFNSSGSTIVLSYSMEWFVIATVVGILIGVAAGVLPARKAAKMDPVVALRYE